MSSLWPAFVSVWDQVTAFLAPLDPLGGVLAGVIGSVLGFSLLRNLLRLVR